MTEPRELGRKSLADGGDAVKETGPIGTRSKNEETKRQTDGETDKKRVVWAAPKGAVDAQCTEEDSRGIKWDGHSWAQTRPSPILEFPFTAPLSTGKTCFEH